MEGLGNGRNKSSLVVLKIPFGEISVCALSAHAAESDDGNVIGLYRRLEFFLRRDELRRTLGRLERKGRTAIRVKPLVLGRDMHGVLGHESFVRNNALITESLYQADMITAGVHGSEAHTCRHGIVRSHAIEGD